MISEVSKSLDQVSSNFDSSRPFFGLVLEFLDLFFFKEELNF